MTTTRPTFVIGIIGPPCSGKSTVARIIDSRGGLWIDADLIAKQQLVEPEVIAALVASFGTGIRASDGAISRGRIADLVFGDDEESHRRLKVLESIIHPRTHEIIESQLRDAIERKVPYVILDVPLLLESGWEQECDQVWCMHIAPERHAELLAARGWSPTELARREQRQLPWEEKRRRSDWVIDNNGTVDELRDQVIKALAATSRRS